MIPIRGLRAPVVPEPPASAKGRFRTIAKPTGPKRYWPPAMDAKLAELWGSDLSARAIAAEIGDGRSHNAVIGRAHRLGLKRRGNPVEARA